MQARALLPRCSMNVPPPEIFHVSTLQVACDGSGEISPALGHPRVFLRMDPRRFLYRSLDPEAARLLAKRHLHQHDDGELYLQYSASEAFGFDDGRLKTADYHSSSGFGLRGVSGET